MTPTQTAIVRAIADAGYTVSQCRVLPSGRVLLAAKFEGRNPLLDKHIYGGIGTHGSISLEFSQFNSCTYITERDQLRGI